MTIEKQVYEAQLQQIFRMLLENKTNEEIASELGISVRTVQNYKQRIDKRYVDFQRSKTDNTIFMECQLFKNRMLSLYKSLEAIVMSDKTSGTDKAKCAEVAVTIAYDLLKLESESIKAVKDLISIEKKNTFINNLRRRHSSNNNNKENYGTNDEDTTQEECDPNRKF
jgi:predicted transcriptional regulator